VFAKSYLPLFGLEGRRVIEEELVKLDAQSEYGTGTIWLDAATST